MRERVQEKSVEVTVLLLGIIFVATNLRAPLTAVGPLTGLIKDNIGISGTIAGFLTTIPLLAFAILSPVAPKIAEKLSLEYTIGYSTIVLVIGLFIRSIPQTSTLLFGTILVGSAIAMCNVLIPSLIKREFNHRLGLITGIYSISMNLCGAIASGVSFPLANNLNLGWNNSLRIWLILALIACIAWIPQLKRHDKPDKIEELPIENSIWHSKTAWQVTIFMGLQSLVFYVLVAWLPEMLIQKGFTAEQAGYLLSMMQLFLLPFTFIIPIIAGRVKRQSKIAINTSILMCLGISGLFINNTIIIGIAFIGISGGCAFGLSMMFFNLKTRNAREGAELSGMAQSIGYLLAAIGPTLFGFMHDMTHNWNVSLIILIVTAILLGGFGFFAGEDKYIN